MSVRDHDFVGLAVVLIWVAMTLSGYWLLVYYGGWEIGLGIFLLHLTDEARRGL